MGRFKKLELYVKLTLLEVIGKYLNISSDNYYSLCRRLLKHDEEIIAYHYDCQIAKSKSNQCNLDFKIPKIVMSSLPESQRRDLSEQRKRWRNEGSDTQVAVKTYYFWFRHFWGSGLSEAGKHVQRFLLNRWI